MTALAIAAMAVDHLMGEGPPTFEDPTAFAISTVLCVALAVLVFGWLVPRTKSAADAGERAAKRGLVLSALAVVAIPVAFWLGLPFILAGGGLALGLVGYRSPRRRLAGAAVVLGALVIALGVGGYGAQLIDKLA